MVEDSSNSGQSLVPPWLLEPEALVLVASELSRFVSPSANVATCCNSGESLVPPWLLKPEALALVTSEPFPASLSLKRHSSLAACCFGVGLTAARAVELTTISIGLIEVGSGIGSGVGVGAEGVEPLTGVGVGAEGIEPLTGVGVGVGVEVGV